MTFSYQATQAHRLSSPDSLLTPPTTTTPDDVFYILKIVLQRLLSTASLSSVERTVAQVKDVMSRDFASVIKKRLDDVYKNVNQSATGPQRERVDKENKSTFIVSVVVCFPRRELYAHNMEDTLK